MELYYTLMVVGWCYVLRYRHVIKIHMRRLDEISGYHMAAIDLNQFDLIDDSRYVTLNAQNTHIDALDLSKWRYEQFFPIRIGQEQQDAAVAGKAN